MEFVDRVMLHFENGKYATSDFLDFSSCFDTMNRNILFDKLCRYGVRGIGRGCSLFKGFI